MAENDHAVSDSPHEPSTATTMDASPATTPSQPSPAPTTPGDELAGVVTLAPATSQPQEPLIEPELITAGQKRAKAGAESLARIKAAKIQCTATSKRTHERCEAHAVTGFTVCYHHGAGGRKRPKEGTRTPVRANTVTARRAVQEMYQQALPPDIRARLRALESDPNRVQLDSEIDLLRTQLAGVVERPLDDEFTYKAKLDMIVRMTEAIGACTTRNVKVRESYRLSLTPDAVDRFVNRVLRAVEIICGPRAAREITDLLAGRHDRAAELGGGGGNPATQIIDAVYTPSSAPARAHAPPAAPDR